jgi:hypothetical protein
MKAPQNLPEIWRAMRKEERVIHLAIITQNVPAAIFGISEMAKIKEEPGIIRSRSKKAEARAERRRLRRQAIHALRNEIQLKPVKLAANISERQIARKIHPESIKHRRKGPKNILRKRGMMRRNGMHGTEKRMPLALGVDGKKLFSKERKLPKRILKAGEIVRFPREKHTGRIEIRLQETKRLASENKMKLLYRSLLRTARKLNSEKIQTKKQVLPNAGGEKIFPITVKTGEVLKQKGIIQKPGENKKEPLFQEVPKASNPVLKLSFALTLWLLLRVPTEDSPRFKHVAKSAPHESRGHEGPNPEEENEPEPTPFVLLAIIRYLAMIREQGMVTYPLPKKKKRRKGNGHRYLAIAASGTIYAYEK